LDPKFQNFQIRPQILVLPNSDKSKFWPNSGRNSTPNSGPISNISKFHPKFCQILPNSDRQNFSEFRVQSDPKFQNIQIRPQILVKFGSLGSRGPKFCQILVEFGRIWGPIWWKFWWNLGSNFRRSEFRLQIPPLRISITWVKGPKFGQILVEFGRIWDPIWRKFWWNLGSNFRRSEFRLQIPLLGIWTEFGWKF